MPNPREYTQARRVVMQMTMWGILLATVGLAAIVDHEIGGVNKLSLGGEQSHRWLHYRLPDQWVVSLAPRNPMIVAIAREKLSSRGSPSRAISVYHRQLSKPMTAAEFLEQYGLFDDAFGSSQPKVDDATMAGVPALRVVGTVVRESPMGIEIDSQAVICAVFPNQQAVALQLSKPGKFTRSDLALLDQVAASVRMESADAPAE